MKQGTTVVGMEVLQDEYDSCIVMSTIIDPITLLVVNHRRFHTFDTRMRRDRHTAFSEGKSRSRFSHICHGWSDGSNEESVRVLAKRILENPIVRQDKIGSSMLKQLFNIT